MNNAPKPFYGHDSKFKSELSGGDADGAPVRSNPSVDPPGNANSSGPDNQSEPAGEPRDTDVQAPIELQHAKSESTDQTPYTMMEPAGDRSNKQSSVLSQILASSWFRFHSRVRNVFRQRGGQGRWYTKIALTSRPKPVCHVTASAMTLQGKRRSRNEDCVYASKDRSCLIVADGLGGCPEGDVASRMAVHLLANMLPAIDPCARNRQTLDAINRTFKSVNDRIVQFGIQHGCPGLSTAVTCAIRKEDHLLITGIGDCRAYLIRQGTMQQLTTDDTLAASLSRFATPLQLERHPFYNILTKCLGTNEFQPVTKLIHLRLQPHDRVLLCTDGLYKALREQVVESIIATNPTATRAIGQLRWRARHAPANDDTSAIVLFANELRSDAPTQIMSTDSSNLTDRHLQIDHSSDVSHPILKTQSDRDQNP